MAEINATIIEETAEYRVIRETYDARPGDVGIRIEPKSGREFNRAEIEKSLDDARARIANIRTRANEIQTTYSAATNAQKNRAVEDLAKAQNDICKILLDIRRLLVNDIDSGPDA